MLSFNTLSKEKLKICLMRILGTNLPVGQKACAAKKALLFYLRRASWQQEGLIQ